MGFVMGIALGRVFLGIFAIFLLGTAGLWQIDTVLAAEGSITPLVTEDGQLDTGSPQDRPVEKPPEKPPEPLPAPPGKDPAAKAAPKDAGKSAKDKDAAQKDAATKDPVAKDAPAKDAATKQPVPVKAAKPEPAAAADVEKLLATLQDPDKRQRLVKELEGLLAAQRKIDADAPPNPVDFLSRTVDRVQELGTDLLTSSLLLLDVRYVGAWFNIQISDPNARARWVEIASNLGIILGLAVSVDFATGLLLRLVRRRLDRLAVTDWYRRLGVLLLHTVLDIMPVAAFSLVATLAMAFVEPRPSIQALVGYAIWSVFTARTLLIVARAVLITPLQSAWSILPIGEDNARYVFAWVRRYVYLIAYGISFALAIQPLGVPYAVVGTLQKIVALVVTVWTVSLVMRHRRMVADWLRPRPAPSAEAVTVLPDAVGGHDEGADPVKPLQPRLDLIRHRLADVWHILAIIYAVAIFIVYALRIDGGFSFVARATVLTILILTAMRIARRFIAKVAQKKITLPPDIIERFPHLEQRVAGYLPLLAVIVSGGLWFFAILSLLEVWGADAYDWFNGKSGHAFTATVGGIGTILAGSFLFWEGVNLTIDRFLSGIDGKGRRVARSARMRTLLPLARNAIRVVLLLIVGLLVLQELGINIAPLLAGAGVVGLAIGFGSQALVKDIITGLFILIEDTVAVGDVVDLGGNHAGAIEEISIRTIKLRDVAGTVHTIPFSDVTKVKNLSKGYAFWVIDLAMPYEVDCDKVIALYREVARSLRRDPAFSAFILDEIEVMGVTSLGPAAVQIQARIKTLPLKQWSVGREFNRRLKKAMDEAGISPPPSQRTLTITEPMVEILQRKETTVS